MHLGLLKHVEDLNGTYYAEFYPGPQNGCHWSDQSVFMDGDAFEALDFVVGQFDLFGPVTLSGGRLDRLIEGLEDAARRISHSDSPKEIWPYSQGYGFTQFNSIEDWAASRRAFSLMLRDLVLWMRAARARNQPVTVRGL